jgi:hypothetical protein
MRILVELTRFLGRLAVGIGVALVFAVLLALIPRRRQLPRQLPDRLLRRRRRYVVRGDRGHSITARTGIHDPYFTSFFPKLIPQLAKPYSGTTLSTSALIFMTAVVLLALGVVLS